MSNLTDIVEKHGEDADILSPLARTVEELIKDLTGEDVNVELSRRPSPESPNLIGLVEEHGEDSTAMLDLSRIVKRAIKERIGEDVNVEFSRNLTPSE